MNIQESIDKFELSHNELVGFRDQSKDEYNKQFLNSEINRLKSKINELKKNLENANRQSITYKSIHNYSWEQTNDKIKIYLNRSDLSERCTDKELSRVEILDKGLSIVIIVDNAKLFIKNLLKPVKLNESNFVKVTKNFVIIELEKVEVEKWTSLQKTTTSIGKGLDKFDKAEDEKDEDPSQSMMKLMKKMYDEGDDEMKRMINKAWSEKGGNMAMPGMPGM